MPGPRFLAPPPAFTPRNFGLLSVVQPRYDEPDSHWRNGVTFQDLCGLGANTYDPYCLVTGTATTPAVKADNFDWNTYGAQPFTVFAEVDCSPVGYSQEEQRARAVDALTRSEGYQVEQVFWTGIAGGDADRVYPHLAATAAVQDTTTWPVTSLQCAATAVTGTTVLDIVEGIGRLESAWAAGGYNGQGVIHVPAALGPQLFQWGLAKADGAQLKTQTGNLIALGAGYPGTQPNGTATPNAVSIYMTGPLFAYRSAPETFRFTEMFDRSTNTYKPIVERTYVIGFTCCVLLTVIVSLGGDVTGQPLSAF